MIRLLRYLADCFLALGVSALLAGCVADTPLDHGACPPGTRVVDPGTWNSGALNEAVVDLDCDGAQDTVRLRLQQNTGRIVLDVFLGRWMETDLVEEYLPSIRDFGDLNNDGILDLVSASHSLNGVFPWIFLITPSQVRAPEWPASLPVDRRQFRYTDEDMAGCEDFVLPTVERGRNGGLVLKIAVGEGSGGDGSCRGAETVLLKVVRDTLVVARR